ncbi:MAG: hypothetical protein JWP63_4643 [Candidatus Solibacter sp.]|nr:hypothetical protein [Candidatus Solibacter sp.]
MRVGGLFFILAAGLAISSCNRDEPAARQVGRDAYRASQEVKQGAKKAGQELRSAGKEIREGWNEAKHENPPPPKKKKPLPRDEH